MNLAFLEVEAWVSPFHSVLLSEKFVMTDTPIEIRRATAQDLPTLVKFGLALAQLHSTFDERRFVVPEDGEVSFRHFLKPGLLGRMPYS